MANTKNRILTLFVLISASSFWVAPKAHSSTETWPSVSKKEKKNENARFAVGPDSNLDLLYDTFDRTQKKLLINIYQFENLEIANRLISRIQDGITVEILLETEPCCTRRMEKSGKQVLKKLYEAMKASKNPNHRIYLMGKNLVRPTQPAKRRFTYDHAKYLISDGKLVHLSSENLTETGHPVAGKLGNRGWDVAIEDTKLAKELEATFREDTDTQQYEDVIAIIPQQNDSLPSWVYQTVQDPQSSEALGLPSPEDDQRRKNRKIKFDSGKIKDAKIVLSPSSLTGIESFMEQAKDTLDIQFMSLPSQWGRQSTIHLNPIVEKAIEQAERGVQVRILLNDERVFADPNKDPNEPRANEITVAFLERLHQCKNIDIRAKIIDIQSAGIRYIHNKGMIADQDRVFVSSINGTQNSVDNNREAALSIESKDTNAYYTKVFNYDWNKTSRTFSDEKTNAAKARLVGCPSVPFNLPTSPTSLLKSGFELFY